MNRTNSQNPCNSGYGQSCDIPDQTEIKYIIDQFFALVKNDPNVMKIVQFKMAEEIMRACSNTKPCIVKTKSAISNHLAKIKGRNPITIPPITEKYGNKTIYRNGVELTYDSIGRVINKKTNEFEEWWEYNDDDGSYGKGYRNFEYSVWSEFDEEGAIQYETGVLKNGIRYGQDYIYDQDRNLIYTEEYDIIIDKKGKETKVNIIRDDYRITG